MGPTYHTLKHEEPVMVEIIQNHVTVYVDLLKDADRCCVFVRGLLL